MERVLGPRGFNNVKGDLMRVRSKAILASTAVVAAVALSACGQLANLQARKAFKDANTAYQAQNYTEAAARYAEVIADPQTAADPNLVHAYFFLGNSYDNLYKPARKGEAANDGYIQKAIQHYQKAAQTDPNPSNRKLAMQYLVAAYGSDKLNDPSQAEPVVKRMIEMEPNEPTNYFGLSKMYEDAGRYDDAEQALLKARDMKPNDPIVFTTLSGYYNRQGDFEKTIDNLEKAAELDPKNPQGFHLIATFYEEKVRKDFRLASPQKKDYSLKGI